MRARFLHIADCHLGYRQYNLRERFNDFGRAFIHVAGVAVAEKVDFVLLAGDLFHKRAIDALTLNQAMAALEKLRQAGIPCIAVQGNHEHAYVDDFMGWLDFLNARQFITLLDARFEGGIPQLKRYSRPYGSYVEPLPGLRIHGLRYNGAGTKQAVEGYAAALTQLPCDDVDYCIFMTHAGIEGEVDGMSGLSMAEWAPLRGHADYVALGHIHKPYTREDWIYNPGSLETCSASEASWPERGYYLVEVDTTRSEGPKHMAKLVATPRRPYVRLHLKADLLASPEALYHQARELMSRRARDLGAARQDVNQMPVVDFHLHGVLQFPRAALEIAKLEEMAKELLHALHPLIYNNTTSVDSPVGASGTVNRAVLEREVLADLFRRDARFADHSRQWARVALDLKNLALDSAAPETILQELEARMDQIALAPPDADDEPADEPESAADPYADPVG
jgi:DNA repair exonuclease SbcCD nuclease subunit